MTIFVMMPLNKKFDDIRVSIREAANRAKVECLWADEMITAGRITEQIVNEIRRSSACIADISVKNLNVAWEIGFAQALGKTMFIILQSRAKLFFDRYDQRAIKYSRENLQTTLVQPLTSQLERLRSNLPLVPPEDLVGTAGHENTSLVLAAKRIADTQYGLFNLIARAKEHLFLAAQNHFFLVERVERGEQLRAELAHFLEGSKSRRVDIMLCDETADYAIRAWKYVTGERYGIDLNLATEFFRELTAWVNAQPDFAGRLSIRQVPFVPLSITFVDPDSLQDGFLVLTPNGYEAQAKTRPCFVISRSKNNDIFQQYWPAYYQKFNDALEALKKYKG